MRRRNESPAQRRIRPALAWLIAGAAALALPACTYYVPAPTTTVVPGAPASFDRSFSAASGAMRDQGLTIASEDRNSGTIVGRIEGGTLTANVRQQADGSVRVQFDASGVRDAGLIDRVSRSYDRRMGR
ncbi:MAG TPA: hypothetical protein VFZ28_18015 [Burkholderiaceae bacterium]|nr:hypothetical protein [Burkholderiaceae bacterium]